MSVTTVL